MELPGIRQTELVQEGLMSEAPGDKGLRPSGVGVSRHVRVLRTVRTPKAGSELGCKGRVEELCGAVQASGGWME